MLNRICHSMVIFGLQGEIIRHMYVFLFFFASFLVAILLLYSYNSVIFPMYYSSINLFLFTRSISFSPSLSLSLNTYCVFIHFGFTLCDNFVSSPMNETLTNLISIFQNINVWVYDRENTLLTDHNQISWAIFF